ncbi:unnamed protein product, partial [Mesorhabditis belari]|uniref:Uncharacterized protein n=1 Tax=Mesorhabditis belari TaxID=2138241 RepID=A0AAF3FCN6_9BILA
MNDENTWHLSDNEKRIDNVKDKVSTLGQKCLFRKSPCTFDELNGRESSGLHSFGEESSMPEILTNRGKELVEHDEGFELRVHWAYFFRCRLNLGILAPKRVMLGFEHEIKATILSMYPLVDVNYCAFHFANALFRQAQIRDLASLYKDTSTKLMIKAKTSILL